MGSKRLREKVERLIEALPPAPGGSHRGPRVRIRRGTDGRVALTFAAIPVDGLREFMAAVKEYLGGT